VSSNYRLKSSVIVEAMQVQAEIVNSDTYEGLPGNLQEIIDWSNTRVTVGTDRMYEIELYMGRIGPVYARPEDWIVKFSENLYTIFDDRTFNQLFIAVG